MEGVVSGFFIRRNTTYNIIYCTF